MGAPHAFVVEIEAQTRVGQDHVFIGVEHVHLVHQPFADHIAVPAAGTPREERRLLGGHRIVERHIGSVFAALENRIVRRIGENLVEFRHGEEALGLDIDLVFERRTHQQTQIDRVTQLAPFLDVSLVHVVLRSVEVLLRLRQQRIGLLEQPEHIAVDLLLAVVAGREFRTARSISLQRLEIGHIAVGVGQSGHGDDLDDGGDGQRRIVLVLLGLLEHCLRIAADRIEIVPIARRNAVLNAIVTDFVGILLVAD